MRIARPRLQAAGGRLHGEAVGAGLLWRALDRVAGNEHLVALVLPAAAGELSCAFCTRSAPEVRLIAGAHGAICEDCAETANNALKARATP